MRWRDVLKTGGCLLRYDASATTSVVPGTPVKVCDKPNLKGIHYFVNADGALQAYEYAPGEQGVDLAGFEAFVDEFCSTVRSRGLQHKFGLKVKPDPDQDKKKWAEMEFPAARSTIMIPEGMPMPDTSSNYSVLTEWPKNSPKQPPGAAQLYCNHTTATCSHGGNMCSHSVRCTHNNQPEPVQDGALYLGGQEIQPGTSVFGLVKAIVSVW